MDNSAIGLMKRHSLVSYFVLTLVISWSGALIVAAPHLLRGLPVSTLSGILMFPAMLLGPCFSGILMARLVDGRAGLQDLFARMRRFRVGVNWYTVLLIPPLLVLVVLFCLKVLVEPVFAPDHFWAGILFGMPAGFLEEIGWMGYAFPKLRSRYSALKAAIILGCLWALWHLPVIDYLGAAAPHGTHWLRFFAGFALAMTAMRVLIGWLYVNTGSVLLAQLMHVSSTGALVVFSPPVTPAQEAMWYAVYGCVLWATVSAIAMRYGPDLQWARSRSAAM